MGLHLRRAISTVLLAAALIAGVMAGPARAADKSASTLASGDQAAGPAWTVRCTNPAADKDKKSAAEPKQCEVFQRLSVKKTGQRVAELAIGFPNDKDHTLARGVLILPLGILLTDDLQMQVDSGAAFKFKLRYCTTMGCFAYLDLNKQALDTLRGGKDLTIMGKAYSGQDVSIKLQLEGLDKALKKL